MRGNRGFTLIELLLVVAIIGLLVALSMPAVQAAREAARRTQCTNNMKQFGVAFANIDSHQGALPSSFTLKVTGPLSGDSEWRMHNYMIDLLPFLDGQASYSQFDQEAMFCAPQNLATIQTPLPFAVCPSAPARDPTPTSTYVPSLYVSRSVREFPLTSGVWPKLDKKYSTTYKAAITDYAVPLEATAGLAKQFGYDTKKGKVTALRGVFPFPFPEEVSALVAKVTPLLAGSGTVEFSIRTRSADITDGLSHTFLLVESAGHPERWQNGVRTMLDEPLYSAWADPKLVLQIGGVPSPSGTCLMQCDNANEIYSFHPDCVNFLFGDGHVQTVPRGVDPKVLLAWLTPAKADGTE